LNAYLNRIRISSHRIPAAACGSHPMTAEKMSKGRLSCAGQVSATSKKEARDEDINKGAGGPHSHMNGRQGQLVQPD